MPEIHSTRKMPRQHEQQHPLTPPQPTTHTHAHTCALRPQPHTHTPHVASDCTSEAVPYISKAKAGSREASPRCSHPHHASLRPSHPAARSPQHTRRLWSFRRGRISLSPAPQRQLPCRGPSCMSGVDVGASALDDDGAWHVVRPLVEHRRLRQLLRGEAQLERAHLRVHDLDHPRVLERELSVDRVDHIAHLDA